MDRPRASEQPIAAFILAFLLAGLYFVYVYSVVSQIIGMRGGTQPQVMTATHALPQCDFARLWYVGKALLIRRAQNFGWTYPVSPWMQSTFKIDILSANQNPALVWLYPPTMALLGSLFSLMPLATSFWVWAIVTPMIAAIALRKSGLSWIVVVTGLACPAGVYNVMCGQTGALTAGCLIASILCFERKPVFSGAMAGLLCIKPQIGLALAMILLRRRYFKALLCCLAVALVMILLSVLVEGWQAWVWFITVAEPKSSMILDAPLGKIVPGGFTVLMMARSFHATLAQAWAMQGLSSAASAFFIWRRWRDPDDDAINRMAFTMCLSVLLTPYGYIYDLVGFSIGMAAMLERAPANLKPIYAGLWLMSGYFGTVVNFTNYTLMPVVAILGAWMIWKARFRFGSAQLLPENLVPDHVS